MTYKIVIWVGFGFFPLLAISADDSLCRDLVKNSFDRAILAISTPKAWADKYGLWVDSYIQNNPLHFKNNGKIEVIGAEESTPIVKVFEDDEYRKTEFRPIKNRKSSLLPDRESTKLEFPSLSDSEVNGCKIQTLELGSETEIHFPKNQERATQVRILTIHALFCADRIKAYKYKGEIEDRVFEKDATTPKVNKSSPLVRGYIFETINGKCVLRTKSLLAPPSEPIGRSDCAKFYTLMTSPGKLTVPVSRDESAKDVCFTKPFVVLRGKNLSSYIPNDIWAKMNDKNIKDLVGLTKATVSKSVGMGNIDLAETLEPLNIAEKDIIRGCDKNQVSLAQSVETLDNLCSDYRTFLPYLNPQPPAESGKKDGPNANR